MIACAACATRARSNRDFHGALILDSGERRQLACSRRQLADDTLFGKLPKSRGWQPALPRVGRAT